MPFSEFWRPKDERTTDVVIFVPVLLLTLYPKLFWFSLEGR
jgi:hypothetical protein